MKKLLYFYAVWCPPCRMTNKEVITPLEKEIGSDKIERINAQSNPSIADKFKVDKLPTTIILNGEKEIFRYTGIALDINELKELLNDKNKKRRKRDTTQ